MADITTFPLTITQNGWTKQTECHCGGIHKVKFVNIKYPNYILEWWVKYYSFAVTYKNQVIQPQKPLKDLQAWLVTFEAEQRAKKASETVKTADVKTTEVKTESGNPFAPAETSIPEYSDTPVETEPKTTKKKTK